MNTTEVFSHVYDHPYYAAGASILALFIIGFLFSILATVGTGANVVYKTVYYVTYPVHASIRYGYRRFNESS